MSRLPHFPNSSSRWSRAWSRPSPLTLALTAAIALPVVGWATALSSVTSLSLSPKDISVGGSSTGSVTIGGLSGSKVAVQLASSNPQVTVPSSVLFTSTSPLGVATKTFPVSSAPGGSAASGGGGCSQISGRVGTSAKTATLFVHPVNVTGSPLTINLAKQEVLGGQSVSGTLTLIPGGNGGSVGLASSNTAVASVAGSGSRTLTMSLQEGVGTVGTASFTINTSVTPVATCAVIAAEFPGLAIVRVLLKVLPGAAG